MNYRKLRIAWSAVWVSACALLFTLWVWSYGYNDLVIKAITPDKPEGSEMTTSLGTYDGKLYLWHGDTGNLPEHGGDECVWEGGGPDHWSAGWDLGGFVLVIWNSSQTPYEIIYSDQDEPPHLPKQFQWTTSDHGSTFVYAGQWLLVLVTAVAAAIPWLPWSKRFTLRTLLIATALVAVALWLIVGAVKYF